MAQSHKLKNEDAINFIIAGNATFTVKNILTSERHTFKVATPRNQNEEEKTKLFVYLLTGSNNEKDYTHIGFIEIQDGGFIQFANRLAWNWRFGLNSPSNRVLNNVLLGLQLNFLNDFEIWHEGRCCRCGRKLTVPESIESGIGPECAMIKAIYEFEKANV